MKKIIITGCLILLFSAGYVYGQSTAMPTQMGYLDTSGVWHPFSISNPLPVISN